MSPVFSNSLIGSSGNQGGEEYQIANSVRLNSDDQSHFTFTPSTSGNRRTWTWACWFKLGLIAESNYRVFIEAFTGSNNVYNSIAYQNGQILVNQDNGSGGVMTVITTPTYRDPSAWYHLVVAFDSTQSVSTNRVKIYINGTLQSSYNNYPAQNLDSWINSANLHRLGSRWNQTTSSNFDGYLADIHFIDGLALDAAAFGESDLNGIWQPKSYSGTYGTNGYHLDFGDVSNNTSSTLGKDVSGNNKNWTPVNLTVGQTWPNTSYRYWRVIVYNDVDHVPRASRYVLTADGTDTNIAVFTSDNCSDSGTIPGSGTAYSYDFGSNKKVSAFKFYSVYNGGSRIGRYEVYYSSDNSNWTEAFRGPMPNNSSCGLIHCTVSSFRSSDVFVDSPTNYGLDTGLGGQVRGNYCTMNPINTKSSFALSNGNLQAINNGFNDGASIATMAIPTSGKWYWEATQVIINGGIYLLYTGLASKQNYHEASVTTPGAIIYPRSGNVCFYDNSGNATCLTEPCNPGDVYGVAYNADTNVVDFYKNGVKYEGKSVTVTAGITYYPFLSIGNQGQQVASINFGQQPWAYAPPAGYKALCTQNLPTPPILDGRDYMTTLLYTGNGSNTANALTVTGSSFQPAFSWIKSRSITSSHILQDANRGLGFFVETNTQNGDQITGGGDVSSYNSNGITISYANARTNQLNATYNAFLWKSGSSVVTNNDGTIQSQVLVDATAGFSIVKWTGNGVEGATVGHGLGVPAKFIIQKNRTGGTAQWRIWHDRFGDTYGQNSGNNFVTFSNSAASYDSQRITGSTSTTFRTTGTISPFSNASGVDYITYCWTDVPGFSKFGYYSGTSSNDGAFVYTGFRPAWLMFKRLDSAESNWGWRMINTAVQPYNVGTSGPSVAAYTDSAEGVFNTLDILSNGFKWRTSDTNVNASGGNHIYMAFAENPFKIARAR